MGRSFVVQATLKGKLEQDFRTYQGQKSLSDADTARELMEFALRILLQEEDDARPSNRELLEETYRRVRLINASINLTHTQTFDGESFYKNKQESQEMRGLVNADVNNKVDAYLDGSDKVSS
uniref:Uncharacterized protein n=1 Tax=Vibrio genomosp. F6 TaxID=723172 RepID=A0A0H3ZQ09_9VIBR|nr:hypothetical protein [Vibrio genomosp. F6]